MSMPEPFTPPDPPPYAVEEDDKLLPSPGFITDFVAALRGVETPTIFCLWSALWALSAASCRLVSVEWLPEKPLYPNLYVFLVAPPGRCHKSTAADFAMKLLTTVRNKFDTNSVADNILKYMADFNWATSKTTPDSLYELLKPREQVIIGNDGKSEVAKGSQLTINVSELATFLNKKKFNVGLVDTLTDLYDCKDHDFINTIARGTQELRDVYVTMIGATTPTGMKESLPFEAFGEGFMSRTIVVYKDKTVRRFPEPKVFKGFPTLEDLRKRLAWIMRYKLGTYVIGDDARDWYYKWYDGWRDGLDGDDRYGERVAEFRFDVNLIRLSTLLAMSRYDPERVITKQDFMDAHAILKGTFKTSAKANVEAGIASTEFGTQYQRVLDFIHRQEHVTRAQMMSNMSSKGIKMAEVRDVLEQLLAEGRIKCRIGHKEQEKISWTKDEIYSKE